MRPVGAGSGDRPETESPPRDPVFPTPGWALLLTLGAVFLQGSLVLTLQPWVGSGRPPAFALSALVAYGLAFAVSTPRIPDPPGPHLGFHTPAPRAWLAIPFLLMAALLISEIDNGFKEWVPVPAELQPLAGPEDTATLATWLLVFAAISPVIEETFFRGLLQPGCVAAWGVRGGIAFVALLNGIAISLTAGPWSFGYAVSAAGLLGFVRHATGSLLPGMLLNVGFGTLAVVATREPFGIPGFDDASAAHTPLGILAVAAVSVGIGLALCRAPRRGP
ncbi:MAG: lysostaphin resistance A-like protein [Myxococcota bacterium]